MTSGAQALDFRALPAMTFEAMDDEQHLQRFPGLKLAWETLNGAPGSCAVLNAANEVAVDAFLTRRIRFDQIHQVNRQTLDEWTGSAPQSLNDLIELDTRSRSVAQSLVGRLK
jgi:1-deoxy-D-xylulose-5-phosphate reductoisomerase